jgi:hypothetical protein
LFDTCAININSLEGGKTILNNDAYLGSIEALAEQVYGLTNEERAAVRVRLHLQRRHSNLSAMLNSCLEKARVHQHHPSEKDTFSTGCDAYQQKE